ncbi:MAG: hypothetical protein IT561_25725 [Alphaproteobacteria bacterium]|nr:hypothetical protein [Alphaproteobacteria bacterium]
MPSALEIVVLAVVVAVLFGSGRLATSMGDVGRTVRRARMWGGGVADDLRPAPTAPPAALPRPPEAR